ncbi:MAG: TIGR01777 family protein [Flavobacteriales bacterium]|nr:TIGR01777 family protein [Flavobacteriales bacterium]
MDKLVIAGGTGTIGQFLIQHLKERFSDIVVLSRSAGSGDGFRKVKWDGKEQGAWSRELDGADVVINLAGKSIQSRFTESNKKALYDSRVDTTTTIGTAIQLAERPPHIWFNASGAAIYPATGPAQANDETVKEIGEGFKSQLSVAWEEAALKFQREGTRQVILRITPVLNAEDGFLPPILRITRLGLGGRQGSGKQMVSWIHYQDLCRAVKFIMDHEGLSGIFNLAAPGPLTNADMMRKLRKAIGMPFGLPAPAFGIKLGAYIMGIEPSLILESSHVVPGALHKAGFDFSYPDFESAIENLI